MSPQHIGRINNGQPLPSQQRQAKPTSGFDALLKSEQEKQNIKVSAHARKRFDQGNIELTDDHQQRIQQAVSKMEKKGADKSLVLMDGMALVVSVKNRTIITAVEENRTKEGVFTNIDSAIII